MHIFLAGATGVLGRHILPLLLDQGHQVTALTRGDDGAAAIRSRGASAVIGDVHDRGELARIVGAAAPDVVMHQLTDLSGGSSDANARIRTIGTRNLVDAARAAKVRRIVAQSIAWAYEGGPDPADEDAPLDLTAPVPRRTTIEGVAALERAVSELPEWVVLRYGLLYGPGTWYTPGGLIADKAHAGTLATSDDVSSFVHIGDAATAAVQALAWPSGATVNVVDDEPAAARDWVPVFCEAVAAPPPPDGPSAPRAPWARGADNHYARKHLGWVPAHPSWRLGFFAE
ncbi:NAD-dependent epimerase/dehydratase family protein [Actinomadura litoris]|uniref:NAD(P)H-binding protein n=1 Tax=Actinomadura litoris TaxID=2678616 RepID=A0A7K1L9V7_9ACTN|nr:NAD(P)-dependent oxidoreductase [Actinomadura litoris]MUN41217.1 NAD(P)H-binding protein [Actinomadura litoris]